MRPFYGRDDVVSPPATLTMLHLLTLRQPTSVEEVARSRRRSKSVVWGHLRKLRDVGLVAMEDGKSRTLRPTAEVVSFDEFKCRQLAAAVERHPSNDGSDAA